MLHNRAVGHDWIEHDAPSDPTALLDELIGETADVDVAETTSGFEYSNAGVPFAARTASGTVELRLGEEIAEAARRTPDTTAAGRGPDWVRFAPDSWDEHAMDRLEAWFRVAWRLALATRR